jgi:ADP-ribose pyrophosphatase
MNLTWKRLPKTEVTKVGWRTVVTKYFQVPDGTVQEYGTQSAENSHCVALIGVTADRKVVVARQFRPGPEMIMNEIPGGFVEAGEDFQAAAIREFSEETGYRVGRVEPLGLGRKSAYSNVTHHYFMAYDCVPGAGQELDNGEFIEVVLMSIPDFVMAAHDGEMTDAPAVLQAYTKLMEVEHGTAKS